MLKEKFNKTKEYIKDHKVEIGLVIAGTGTIFLGYKLNTRLGKVTAVAKRSIDREIKRAVFEIEEFKKFNSTIGRHYKKIINIVGFQKGKLG